jgi:hypothetical protein
MLDPPPQPLPDELVSKGRRAIPITSCAVDAQRGASSKQAQHGSCIFPICSPRRLIALLQRWDCRSRLCPITAHQPHEQGQPQSYIQRLCDAPKRHRYPLVGQETGALPPRRRSSKHQLLDHEAQRVDGSISITKSNHSVDVPRMCTRYSSCLAIAVPFSACPAE